MMDSRERVKEALNFNEVDFVPVIPPFQGFWALMAAGYKISETFREPMKGAHAQMAMLEKAPFDGFEVIWDWLSPVEACGCKVNVPDDGNPITMERVVKTIDDAEKLQIPDIGKHARSVSDFEVARTLVDKYGKSHYTYATLALPFTLAGELRGVEALMLDILKKPQLVHRLLDFSSKVLLEYAKAVKETGVDAIFWCDPTASADLISARHFKAFAVPYIKGLVAKTKEMGLGAFLHICGNTTDRLDSILEISPDLMSVDTKVDLANAKILDKRVALMGNVNTSNLLLKKPTEIIAEAKECISKAGRIGYALGAGCDIPIGSPLENVRALWDAPRQ
uniref:Uroporphyrinogen decarboxylase (URO-D) domain-containing protein n=1 Tax=Candidatus Methanomethylicus mesodigestus TaxID=1867258 RepID=A0A7C3EZB9_9CREN